MSTRFLLMSALIGGIAMLSGTACLSGERGLEVYERSLTSTVTLSTETILATNVPLALVLTGSRRNDVLISVDVAVTASTLTLARTIAESMEISAETIDDVALGVTITEPPQATLEGIITIELPRDMDVQVVERGPSAEVTGVDGSIDIMSSGQVIIRGAQNDVRVQSNGPTRVDTDLLPGQVTSIRAGSGIELIVPAAVSAQFDARAPQIVIDHPQLPRHAATNLPYRASVNGGLNIVEMAANNTILIRSR